jgi:hypothetical protein
MKLPPKNERADGQKGKTYVPGQQRPQAKVNPAMETLVKEEQDAEVKNEIDQAKKDQVQMCGDCANHQPNIETCSRHFGRFLKTTAACDDFI